MATGEVTVYGTEWPASWVSMHDLVTGDRFVTEDGKGYAVTSGPADNTDNRVYVHHLDEGDNPLELNGDSGLLTDGFYGPDDLPGVWRVDDDAIRETPAVAGVHLALTLDALHFGTLGYDSRSGTMYHVVGHDPYDLPSYGVEALNFCEEHGLAVDVDPDHDGGTITDAGSELLAVLRRTYQDALQAGWTEVPVL
jgi:hypothetical protein